MSQEIQIHNAGNRYETKSFTFPGGELQVQVPGLPDAIAGDITVLARLQSADALIHLLLTAEVLFRAHLAGRKRLIIPYFPYARQDRVMQPGEAFSLKAVARFVNGLGFDEVVTCDPHSDVTAALVENIRITPQVDLVVAHQPLADLLRAEHVVVVAPDAGAMKKAFAVSQRFVQPFIAASKIRDTKTGSITHAQVPETPWLVGHDALIVDDICDGGRTFIELARALKANGANRVFLYVTHGIFSLGLGVFAGLVDGIFSTDSFLSRDIESPHQSPVPLHVSPIHF